MRESLQTLGMMESLLWKDFRLNRLIVILAVVLAILPYPWMAILTLGTDGRSWQSPEMWRLVVQSASFMSLAVSILSGALFAGNALACERAARSSEFLAYLPPPRWCILLSKLTIALGVLAVLSVGNMFVALKVTPLFSDGLAGAGFIRDMMAEQVLDVCCVAILAFGLAWCGSALLESPAIAASLGIAGCLVVVTAIITIKTSLDWPFTEVFAVWRRTACASVGGAAFVASCVVYLRRADP
jgi:ABC-type transport system involved in multi-copper enzyme maturation permease subunit